MSYVLTSCNSDHFTFLTGIGDPRKRIQFRYPFHLIQKYRVIHTHPQLPRQECPPREAFPILSSFLILSLAAASVARGPSFLSVDGVLSLPDQLSFPMVETYSVRDISDPVCDCLQPDGKISMAHPNIRRQSFLDTSIKV